MFKNCGAKLKTLATVLFWIQVVIFTIIVIVLANMAGSGLVWLLLPVFYLIAWLSTIFIAAFGELCKDVNELSNHITKKE
jgi:hypothetical protein